MRHRWLLETRPALGLSLAGMLLMPPFSSPALAQTDKASHAVHQVKRGESLWTIAKQHFGRGTLWPRVYRANSQVIGKNPSVIRPGMRLRLDVLPGASAPPVQAIAEASPLPDPPKLPDATLAPVASPVELEASRGVMPVEEVVTPALMARPDAGPAASKELGAAAGSFGLTYLPVASSLVVPGSGQAMQGRWEKGVTHLGLMTVSLLAFKAASEQGDRPMQVLGGLGLVGIALWSPWDAYQALTNSEKPQAADHP